MIADAVMADVSVVMPAYRNAATIGAALASIARQSMPPREVIVVDDGSDDGTFEAANEAVASMGRTELRVLRQRNQGPGAARNRALLESRGEVVAFLDADDQWLPQKLARSLAVMNETGSDMVAHDYFGVTPTGRQQVDCTRHFRHYPDPFVGQLLRGYISSTTVVVRREIVVAAGGFDPALPSGQDYDLWLAILALPDVRFTMFPEALSQYTIGMGGITGKIEQRRHCAMTILKRFSPRLKDCPGGGLRVVVMRALIVQFQAAQAHFAQRQPAAAIVALLQSPATVAEAITAANATVLPRPNFLGVVFPPASPVKISHAS